MYCKFIGIQLRLFWSSTISYSRTFQQCAGASALSPAKQAHAMMILSGFTPSPFVLNCLLHLYAKCSAIDSATKLFLLIPHPDVVSHNTLLSAHLRRRSISSALRLFNSIPSPDVVSWNSIISAFSLLSHHHHVLHYFLIMWNRAIGYDHATFALVLKSSGFLGTLLHSLVFKLGLLYDVYVGSALVDMYAKRMKLQDSLTAFSELPVKNSVTWSAVIGGCVHNGDCAAAIEYFKEMQKEEVNAGQAAYASLFRGCAGCNEIGIGSQLHCHSLKTGFQDDVVVGTATLDMYAKCGSVSDARKVFDEMRDPTLQSFNAIITGYAQSSHSTECFRLFSLLHRLSLGFDDVAISGALSASTWTEGVQIHALSVKIDSGVCVNNAVICMYGNCGSVDEARKVFDEMRERDAISWNAIISAHEQNGIHQKTLLIFKQMIGEGMEPDEFTYGSVIKSCSDSFTGMQVHSRILKTRYNGDVFVLGSLVDMYCKAELLKEAAKIHERVGGNGTVSWNAMISGYASAKESEEAQRLLTRMVGVGVQPDNFTYASVLDTCADLATIGLGKQIHCCIIKLALSSELYVLSTLVDMYSKCGSMRDARLVFEKALKKDEITWNAMICGYSQHGHAEDALELYGKMVAMNIAPNHATFVSVLRACAHVGLVDEATAHFESMESRFNLPPQLEHYSCVIDALGRSGRIGEALRLINEMPFEPDPVVWRNLLIICKEHGNVEVAEKAAAEILRLEPRDSSVYILMSNLYADTGKWEKVSEMRKEMRMNRVKKEPGCSWIEVKDEMHTFIVGDKSHPFCGEIYLNLSLLSSEMKMIPSLKIKELEQTISSV